MRTAACLFSYNRPDYLRQVIKSLEEQTASVDWYFFQDGPLDALDAIDVSECTNILANSSIDAVLRVNNNNECIAKQKLKAHNLFLEYDFVVFFEDDMVVSPFYIELLQKMHSRFPEDLVYAPDRFWDAKSLDLTSVIENWTHFWGYGMGSDLGKKITPFLQEYDDFLDNTPYRHRPSSAIREKWHVGVTSHDAILDYALKTLGKKKFTLKIPRGRYIGMTGMHATMEHFRRNNFDILKPFSFLEDKLMAASDLKLEP